jgi:hypothetical protein
MATDSTMTAVDVPKELHRLLYALALEVEPAIVRDVEKTIRAMLIAVETAATQRAEAGEQERDAARAVVTDMVRVLRDIENRAAGHTDQTGTEQRIAGIAHDAIVRVLAVMPEHRSVTSAPTSEKEA